MNRNQLLVLLVVLAVLGGAGLVLMNHNRETWSEKEGAMGQKVLPNFPVNDISQIHVKGNGGDLHLVRKNDVWAVEERGDYPANFSQVRDLLVKLVDLKVAQSEPIGPSQLARLELEQPGKGAGSGTLVEFQNAQGKTLDSLLLGKKHMRSNERAQASPFGGGEFPDGRYVLKPEDPKDALLISDALSDIDTKPEPWLNHDFFKVDKVASVSFVSANATNSWTITRTSETSPWVLSDLKPGEILDSNKVSSVGSTLNFPSFVDVSTNAKPEETGMDKPQLVTIETFDHFTYKLKIGKKTPENNYNLNVAVSADIPAQRAAGKDEKPEEKTKLDKEFADKNKPLADKLKQEQSLAKWTYLVNSWLVDPLIRDRSQLMVDKKDEKAADKTVSANDAASQILSSPVEVK
jgi:hypothetical protein